VPPQPLAGRERNTAYRTPPAHYHSTPPPPRHIAYEPTKPRPRLRPTLRLRPGECQTDSWNSVGGCAENPDATHTHRTRVLPGAPATARPPAGASHPPRDAPFPRWSPGGSRGPQVATLRGRVRTPAGRSHGRTPRPPVGAAAPGLGAAWEERSAGRGGPGSAVATAARLRRVPLVPGAWISRSARRVPSRIRPVPFTPSTGRRTRVPRRPACRRRRKMATEFTMGAQLDALRARPAQSSNACRDSDRCRAAPALPGRRTCYACTACPAMPGKVPSFRERPCARP